MSLKTVSLMQSEFYKTIILCDLLDSKQGLEIVLFRSNDTLIVFIV